MEVKKPIQVIYSPGTWGNTLRWLLDRFSADSNFKDMSEPWDNDGRVHGFHNEQYNPAFARGHQIGTDSGIDDDTKKIVICFDQKEFLFVERCKYFRHPDFDTEELRYKNIIAQADKSFVADTFGNINQSVTVAKELLKIRFHDSRQIDWLQDMVTIMNNKSYHRFDLKAMWDKTRLIEALQKISASMDLNLQIDENVITSITDRVASHHVVKTQHRADEVLVAIDNNDILDCNNLDIIEQAYIEAKLESKHDSLLFPYGTNWFNNTKDINNFISTYPSYLKHMNPRLPWYNNIKNPFHLTGKIDK